MKYLLFVILLLPFQLKSQNLIPNGSFEDTVACPTALTQIDYTLYWMSPTLGSPDYFHYCSNYVVPGLLGYQLPHDGVAYAGIILGTPTSNFREYLEIPLIAPLTPGNCYQLSFYANSAHHKYTTDAIQAFISDSLMFGFQTSQLLPCVPQISNLSGNLLDTLNWTLIQGEFVATGLEQFIIIGNFIDKSLCNWFLQDSTLGVTVTSYSYIDDVSLIEVTCTGISDESEYEITIYPNPAVTTLIVKTNLPGQAELIIYDALMRKCIHKNFTTELTINISGLSQGTYYYTLQSSAKILKNGTFFK